MSYEVVPIATPCKLITLDGRIQKSFCALKYQEFCLDFISLHIHRLQKHHISHCQSLCPWHHKIADYCTLTRPSSRASPLLFIRQTHSPMLFFGLGCTFYKQMWQINTKVLLKMPSIVLGALFLPGVYHKALLPIYDGCWCLSASLHQYPPAGVSCMPPSR